MKPKYAQRGNQRTCKGEQTPQRGQPKNAYKGGQQKQNKRHNANNEKKKKMMGLPPKKKDGYPFNNIQIGEDQREKKRIRASYSLFV